MMNKTKDKYFLFFCLVVSIFLFCLSTFRALTYGISCDEAYTYMYYVYQNPFKVFEHLFRFQTLANNHLLNTFAISVTQLFFNTRYNELIIRIPNLLCYIPYLYFSFMFTKNTKYRYANFSMLVFNYGVNEYISLGRGYGMACSFILIGLYYFKQYLDNKSFSKLTLSYLFLLISCYAQTCSLLVFGIVIIFSLVKLIKDKDIFRYIIRQWYFLLPIVVFFLLISNYHLMVSKYDPNLYISTNNFYHSVPLSYLEQYGITFYTSIISYAIIFITLVLLIVNIKKIYKFQCKFTILTISYFILFIIISKVTGNTWMTGRTLIPSTPLIVLMFIELLDSIDFKKTWIVNVLIYTSVFIPFIKNINVDQTIKWSYINPMKDRVYKAYKNKDNSNITDFDKEKFETKFYREKIMLEYNYDIFDENIKADNSCID